VAKNNKVKKEEEQKVHLACNYISFLFFFFFPCAGTLFKQHYNSEMLT